MTSLTSDASCIVSRIDIEAEHNAVTQPRAVTVEAVVSVTAVKLRLTLVAADTCNMASVHAITVRLKLRFTFIAADTCNMKSAHMSVQSDSSFVSHLSPRTHVTCRQLT